MYAEKSNTGYNLMDMSRRNLLTIYNALQHAAINCNLSTDDRSALTEMMHVIESELPLHKERHE